MKEKIILGLDLGIASIGWAILEEKGNQTSIKKAGVRIYTPCTEPKGNKLKNESRRTARHSRRQNYRKRLRKFKLLQVLSDQEFCPINKSELKIWLDDKYKFPQSEPFLKWLKINPYELRSRAVNGEVTKEELGRIFYHFIQRRGFLSNRKIKEDGKIFKGSDATGNIGINATQQSIDKFQTLGEYLYSIMPQEGKSYANLEARIRGRYTTRKMYIDEFNKIWHKQASRLDLDKIHIENDKKTKSFREALAGNNEDNGKKSLIFWQRDLKSQKNLISKCQFEKDILEIDKDGNSNILKRGKRVSSKSHPNFEEYRMWKFLNDIKYDNSLLKKQIKEEFIKRTFNQKEKKFKFEDLFKTKKNNDLKEKYDNLEKFNYQKDTSIPALKTINSLKNLFDEDVWNTKRSSIWHCVYTYTDNKKLYDKLKKDYSLLSNITEEKISKITLDDDYCNISLHAINNILPYLKQGYQEHKAILLGGVVNCLKKKNQIITDTIENEVLTIISSHNRESENRESETIDRIKKFLIANNNFSANDKAFLYLYHNTQDVFNSKISDKIPIIENLRNPIVQQSLSEVRKLINTLLKQGFKFDQIKIELAREIKMNKKQKENLNRNNRSNSKLNDEARNELVEHGLTTRTKNIHLYKVWQELKEPRRCPYTGTTASLTETLSDTGTIQLEHIVPRSISFNNSLGNKTICETNFNNLKGNKTPHQFWLECENNGNINLWGNDIESWQDIKDRAYKILPYNKAKNFCNENEQTNKDFISRNLNDTRYISRKAKEIINSICKEVFVCSGSTTGMLRGLWGLNNFVYKEEIIPEFNNQSENDKKNRDNHYHHLVDAVVIALTGYDNLRNVSQYYLNKENKSKSEFTSPWKNFRNELKVILQSTFISHKKTSSTKGRLHKETNLGKYKDHYVTRKSVSSLSVSEKNKIVDSKIKQLVNDEDFYLKNSNGDDVPIKKVRIKSSSSNAIQLNKDINRYVLTGNNHHIVIYLDNNNKIQEEVVSLYEVSQRVRKKQEVFQLPKDGKELLFRLEANDMYVLGLDDDSFNKSLKDNDDLILAKHLYRVQKISSNYYWFRKQYDTETNGAIKNDAKEIRSLNTFMKLNAKKVFITIDGELNYYD